MGFRIYLSFRHFDFPLSLTLIDLNVGDFITFSDHPTKIHDTSIATEDEFLHKNLTPLAAQLDNRLILPTYKFASGWGTRRLSTKEIFCIWGYSDLLHNKISSDQITNLVPIQLLTLAILSYLRQSQKPLPTPLSISLKQPTSPTKLTFLKDINSTINHDWMYTSVIDNNTRKSDKAHIPTHMWNSRICLSFPLRKDLTMLIKAIHFMLLHF